MKLTDSQFEDQYKDFLAVRREWSDLVRAISIANDVSSEGDDVRHVGLTNSHSILSRAKELVLRWQKFADLADEKRAAGVHTCNPAIYLPVPKIIDSFKRFTINRFSATSVKKIRREDILLRLEKRIRPNSSPYSKPEILRDIKTFTTFPVGTLFRVRIRGYNDLFIDFYNDGTQERRERVGAYGVILDSSDAADAHGKVEWPVNSGARKNESIYDDLIPLRCSLFSAAEVYLLDDVERAKKAAKKENKKRSRDNYEATRKTRKNKTTDEQKLSA